jgi:GNAT superfamily N-acetyltransferase
MGTPWNIAAVEAYADDYPGLDSYQASLVEVEADRSLPGTIVLSHMQSDDVVAGAMVRPSFLTENCFDLSWVFVAKRHRGNGYGYRIISAAIAKIETDLLGGERGSILISVLDHNVPLYEKFGFVLGARLHDGVTMVRIANPSGPLPKSCSVHACARNS